MNKFLLFLSLLLLVVFTADAAETGKPFMTVYTSKEIGGHIQNWAITQDSRGVIYVGNGYGVLEFDGSTWRMILSPNQSFARAFAQDANGRIYVGSSAMLGYLEADEPGLLQYHSLLEYIKPDDRNFNYVWSVQATPRGIYFQTQERLFRFRPATTHASNEKSTEDWQVQVWRARANFSYTFWIDETLYVQQSGIGLMKMVNDSLVLIPGGEQFANDRLQVMLPFPGKPGCYLLGTFNRGLFLWNGNSFQPFPTDADALLRGGPLYAGAISPDNCFALGSISSGFFIIDTNGRTKLHLTQASGLTSNTVSAVFVDAQKNIWLGMDGGIVVLEYSSPLSQFAVTSGSGPGDFHRYKGILYAASNDGVYYLDGADSQFKKVTGISASAQSFYFHEINNDLYVATGSGIYRIQGTTANLALRIDSLSFPLISFGRFSPDSSVILCGTIDGLVALRYDARNPDRLRLIGRVAGVHEYIRTMVESEPGIVWLGAMDADPIRLHFRADDVLHPIIERFGAEQGLPIGGVTAYHVTDRMFFGTKQGIYKFNPEQKTFSRDPFFDGVELGRNPDESAIIADQDGNIWANLGRESVVFKLQPNGTYQLEKQQLARFADDPTSIIYPEANGVVWFGTASSAVRLAPNTLQAEQVPFPALVRRVSFANDSIIFHGTKTAKNNFEDPDEQFIPFRFNAMRFDYAATSYLNPQENEFRTRLEGFDQSWSGWSRETRRNYTNLPAEKYRFRVQARNSYGQESQEDGYAFTIQTAWYASWYAWLVYICLGGGLIYGLVRIRTRQLQQRSNALEKIVQERTVEIQSQKDNVEQLSLIGREITGNLSVPDIINTVYENVNRLMDAAVFGIGSYQVEKGALVFPATKEKGITLPEFSVPLTDEDRLAIWCFKNQQPVIINDYSRDFIKYIQQLQPAMAGENPESILYLPLQHKDKTIGVITAQSFKKHAYSDYHLNMLRNLATYSAIALENADAYRRLNELLDDLKTTQEKLVTQSKLAALGALTAGIAHEIKNPLNFVNNFAELSRDLVQELEQELAKEPPDKAAIIEILQTLQQNAARINEHGKRADSIVKSMLQHSRGKAGERQPTDINAMLEEDINLAYHGMRAQDSSFNIKIETDFDPSIGKLEVVPQDISRVFLNIINNACYEAHRKKIAQNGSFVPILSVRTRKLKDKVEIRIRDNGNGIPEAVREKLFTPFFTTKPAGQGTGLGLSISYDIVVQGHNGQISFQTEEGQFTEFVIILPG